MGMDTSLISLHALRGGDRRKMKVKILTEYGRTVLKEYDENPFGVLPQKDDLITANFGYGDGEFNVVKRRMAENGAVELIIRLVGNTYL